MSNQDSIRPGSKDQNESIDVFQQGFNFPKGFSVPSGQASVIEEDIVEVKFSFFSTRFGKMVNHYYALLEEVACFDFQQSECDITLDEWRKYCNTILLSRIRYVRKKASLGFEKFIIGPTDPVVLIPDLLKTLINHIGVVRDSEYGLVFEPVCVQEKDLPLSKGKKQSLNDYILNQDQMHQLARKLMKYQRAGVTMWTEYHRTIDGCPSFMGFSVAKEKVMHYLPKQSMTKALFASIMDITGIEMIINPRLYYGDVNKMDMFLAGLIQRKSP
jgi:hypothetical protein